MSQKNKNPKQKKHPILLQVLPHTEENSLIPKTPVKKSTSTVQESFSSTLSPLPFPPKVEIPHYQGSESLSGGMKIVETPVAKEPKIFLIGAEINDGNLNRIIFESQEEDDPNNSSSAGSSMSEEEEDEANSDHTHSKGKQEQQSDSQGSNQDENQPVPYTGRHSSQKIGAMLHARPSATKPQEASGKKIFCNCKKTKCLKLYCDCFRLNQTCEGCNCQGCHNLQIYNEERNNAILALMDRNPDPFSQKIEDDKHLKGCNCKKSNCLKKYCECYQAGLKCGQNCKCQQCKNIVKQKNGQPEKGMSSRQTAKKQRKMVEILP